MSRFVDIRGTNREKTESTSICGFGVSELFPNIQRGPRFARHGCGLSRARAEQRKGKEDWGASGKRSCEKALGRRSHPARQRTFLDSKQSSNPRCRFIPQCRPSRPGRIRGTEEQMGTQWHTRERARAARARWRSNWSLPSPSPTPTSTPGALFTRHLRIAIEDSRKEACSRVSQPSLAGATQSTHTRTRIFTVLPQGRSTQHTGDRKRRFLPPSQCSNAPPARRLCVLCGRILWNFSQDQDILLQLALLAIACVHHKNLEDFICNLSRANFSPRLQT